jgi:hydroxymethylpyrimidine pyrophosphatase-like HAD family hydrolase
MRMVIFDLDGTLAEAGKPVPSSAVSALRTLEKRGVQVALCSGKPTYYLCGLARQLGLDDVALIGETGFAVQIGVDLPPRVYHEMPLPPGTKRFLSSLESEIRARLGDSVWFQPNSGSLTVFFYDSETKEKLDAFLSETVSERGELLLFDQPDCFDITIGLTKADGIRWLLAARGLAPSDVTYVGDGHNDQPAFDLIPDSIAIDPTHSLRARTHVDTLEDALQRVTSQVERRGRG